MQSKTFKEEIFSLWSRTIKDVANTIKDKIKSIFSTNKLKEPIKPKKSYKKKLRVMPHKKRAPLKSNRGVKIEHQEKISNKLEDENIIPKKISIINQINPISEEILENKTIEEPFNNLENVFKRFDKSIRKETLFNKNIKLNEAFLKIKDQAIVEDLRPEKPKFVSKEKYSNKLLKISEQNDLKKTIIQKKLRCRMPIKRNFNDFIPKTQIPEFDHFDEILSEASFDVPIWANDPEIGKKVLDQNHLSLKEKFINNPVDVVEMFPKIKNLTNDSPTKWD